MNENQSQVIPEQIKEQQQQSVTHQAIEKKEDAPVIKSEENQANWKAFREEREKIRREKEEAQKRAYEENQRAKALQLALEAAINKPSHFNQQPENELEESEDQRMEKRIQQIIEEREKKSEQQRMLKEQEEAPQKIARSYPDFNKICTQENCDYLDYHYPEITAPFKHMPDGYEKWELMYKVIKKFVPNTDATKDMSRAEKNLQKPGSISTPGGTQGQSSMPSARLDEARKAANWERMQKTISGLS
jgi:hypothetical protein